MSKPGDVLSLWLEGDDLDSLRLAVLNWLLARYDGVRLAVYAPPAVHEALEWLGLGYEPREADRSAFRESHRRVGWELPVMPFLGWQGTTWRQLRSRGFLPEAVLSSLAQSGWRGRSACFTGVTHAEMVVRFSPEGLLKEPVTFSLEDWEILNRDRLREMPPSELLTLLEPYLESPAGDRAGLEAAIMMHCEEVDNLVQLAQAVSGTSALPG